MIVHHIM